MRISAKINYALRALVELGSEKEREKSFTILEISRKQKIPQKYLVQILLQLKREKIIASLRGKKGGYYLVKPLDKIHLDEIFIIFEGEHVSVSEQMDEQNSQLQKHLNGIWRNFDTHLRQFTARMAVQDILDAVNREKGAYTFHI